MAMEVAAASFREEEAEAEAEAVPAVLGQADGQVDGQHPARRCPHGDLQRRRTQNTPWTG